VAADAALVDCAQILAIAVDQTTANLYYWLLTDENLVEVHAMSVFGRELARKIGTAERARLSHRRRRRTASRRLFVLELK